MPLVIGVRAESWQTEPEVWDRPTHSDLRWWLDRRGDCLLHEPTRRIAYSHRALRGRRSRIRQVGWFSGARLVPGHPAGSTGTTKLRASCSTFLRPRGFVGISAVNDLRRLRCRGQYRTR